METFRGFITDFDGTLCDTLEANLKSYELAFQDADLSFSKPDYKMNFGLRFPEMMQHLAPDASTKILETVKQRKAIHYKNNVGPITVNEPLIRILKTCKARGAPIGLATTARRENATSVLLAHGLADLFDVSIFGEDVNHGKPDPECYQLVIQKLGLKPEDCIVSEDSEIGMQAAARAGAMGLKVTI